MKVPSENELIEHYGISNTTARKILQEIENIGWVLRVKGKGTYVRTESIKRNVNRILGFTKNMIVAGYKPSTKVLDVNIVPRGYSILLNGRRYYMKEKTCRIKRLRYADNLPMMFETRHISTSFCPNIETHDFTKSLYSIYEEDYGLTLSLINQMIRADVITDKNLLELFGIQNSIPVLIVEGVTFCGKEMVLEIEKSIYRGDKYSFYVQAI